MYGLVRAGIVSVLDRVVSKDAYAYALGSASDLEEGVVCTVNDPTNDFKVELTTARYETVAERALRAIAASMPEVCLDLRWTSFSCVKGGKHVMTVALESPGRKLPPSRVANALAVALADLLDAASAKNVEVVALVGGSYRRGPLFRKLVALVGGSYRRGPLFRKLVAYVATVYDKDVARPGQACDRV